MAKLLLGISSCLVGEKVRYDGSHKSYRYALNTLSAYFDFVPVCPEVGIGLGVPRPTIRIVSTDEGLRARGVKDAKLDVTEPLSQYIEHAKPRLGDIDGYILKAKSPSCGMERVKVYSEKGHPVEQGSGFYAAALMNAYPLLPIEEEGRLNDAKIRENFLVRVFVHQRWRQLLKEPSPKVLVEFHRDHKYLLLSHSQAGYKRLGQIAASAGAGDLADILDQYGIELFSTLKRKASNKSHTNVLQHLLGYLKKDIGSEDKQEMLDIIDKYRLGQLPLIVPVTMLKHYFRKYPNEYILRQHYLQPHPFELMLRNQV
jgi:uncharacterized protein YbgA (DUF1722 family)/uncharacterized protein YbbK (DUF523 family)